MRERLRDLDVLGVLICYLVLCACGWALDHLLVETPEPAP